MKKRMVVMLVAVLAFIGIVGGYKYMQIRKMMAMVYTPPAEAVTTVIASSEDWRSTSKAIGTVAAVNGVTVSADLPGIVQQITFNSGQAVGRGDVLVRLDTKQEQAQLTSAMAQFDLARLALGRAQNMVTTGVASQESLDQAQAQFKSADARVGEIRASIERKTIRAPFGGVIGIRQINLGEYLAGGAPVASLQAVRPAYVNFTVPQQEMARLSPGTTMTVTSDALGDATETGKISAVDSFIDETTRNVKVQAIFENRSGLLRPGMYVEAELPSASITKSVTLPVSAISYAPFGNSVFIVEQVKGPDGKEYRGVRQQFVKLGASRGDQVAVLTGVKTGEEVVTSGVFKLRPGAAVVVNNSVQPGNSAKPSPENS